MCIPISFQIGFVGGHQGALQALLNHLSSQSYTVYADESHNISPLHLAAYRGHKGAVAALSAMKSDVNIMDQNGRTPLDWAASQGHVDCVATLVDFGAQQDLAQPETQHTPLHRAAARGHAMCLQQLLHTYVADGFILRLTRDP